LNISFSQTSTDQSGTAYIGNIEYNTLNGNASLTTLSRIYNDEGYVENPANPQYYYFRHDHLGDNREVWCANTNTVAQLTQYYPSGLPWAYDRTLDHPDLQHRKYNGKEFVEMHGLDTYDNGARGYYPAMGRFMTVDPLAEKYYSISPYAYCAGNPVRFIDPDGRGILDYIKNIKNTFKQEVKKGIDVVNKVVEKITGSPLISKTGTTKVSKEYKYVDSNLGDKVTVENSTSTKIGKGDGLINLDVTTNNNKVESVGVSTKSGNTISVDTKGVVSTGQSIGNTEVHTGKGPGIGLGEYTVGASTTINGVTFGTDISVRPGGYTVIGAGVIIGVVAVPESAIPFIGAKASSLEPQFGF